MAQSENDYVKALERIACYYVMAGWPRYTERQAPRPEWDPFMTEAQSTALEHYRARHAAEG